MREKNDASAGREALLDAREERWLRRLELSERGTLLTVTLNLPGPDKCLPRWLAFYDAARKDLEEDLIRRGYGVALASFHLGPAGPETHFVNVQAQAAELKRWAVEFEERHPAGRLLDLDIMAPGGKPLGRECLGLPPRSCLCCRRPAKECAAQARHPLDQIMEAAEDLLRATGF
jgi:holo-ACP synthase